MINVKLTKKDAEQFKKFMEYYDIFGVLVSSGIFELKNTSATLNFNNDGVLMDIDTETKVYKRSK